MFRNFLDRVNSSLSTNFSSFSEGGLFHRNKRMKRDESFDEEISPTLIR